MLKKDLNLVSDFTGITNEIIRDLFADELATGQTVIIAYKAVSSESNNQTVLLAQQSLISRKTAEGSNEFHSANKLLAEDVGVKITNGIVRGLFHLSPKVLTEVVKKYSDSKTGDWEAGTVLDIHLYLKDTFTKPDEDATFFTTKKGIQLKKNGKPFYQVTCLKTQPTEHQLFEVDAYDDEDSDSDSQAEVNKELS